MEVYSNVFLPIKARVCRQEEGKMFSSPPEDSELQELVED